jgi:xanthine/CO dehydrogenase XdhC/CoxF family maturation factor
MTDFEIILPLWRELETAAVDYLLSTVVAVEGSSYRRPGARMLLAPDGRRAGTISGGCLEAEVAKRAWWLTENGPRIERYSTLEDDGDLPYGSGCGGVVYILLERRSTAQPFLETLHAAFQARAPLAIATVLEGPHIGHRFFAAPSPALLPQTHFANPSAPTWQVDLRQFAVSALESRRSHEDTVLIDGQPTRVWTDYRASRPGLWIFGAGDDALPVVSIARQLGWFVAVADGRSNLATASRFPGAHVVIPLSIADLPQAAPAEIDLRPGDAAVLMTHSFDQDSRILATLLSRAPSATPAYIGVLGPQRRTREALAQAARLLDLVPSSRLLEQWMGEIHAPMGLDLGAHTPSSIALSIVAEIQKSLTASTALPLHVVRAAKLENAR